MDLTTRLNTSALPEYQTVYQHVPDRPVRDESAPPYISDAGENLHAALLVLHAEIQRHEQSEDMKHAMKNIGENSPNAKMDYVFEQVQSRVDSVALANVRMNSANETVIKIEKIMAEQADQALTFLTASDASEMRVTDGILLPQEGRLVDALKGVQSAARAHVVAQAYNARDSVELMRSLALVEPTALALHNSYHEGDKAPADHPATADLDNPDWRSQHQRSFYNRIFKPLARQEGDLTLFVSQHRQGQRTTTVAVDAQPGG